MLRLGSTILASVLLGVPRALDTRAFGVQRSVYIRVAPESPELTAFTGELTRALGGAGLSTGAQARGETLVVEVHALWKAKGGSGPAREREAVSFTARDRRGTRRLLLHYAPEARSAATRALLRCLEGERLPYFQWLETNSSVSGSPPWRIR